MIDPTDTIMGQEAQNPELRESEWAEFYQEDFKSLKENCPNMDVEDYIRWVEDNTGVDEAYPNPVTDQDREIIRKALEGEQ